VYFGRNGCGGGAVWSAFAADLAARSYTKGLWVGVQPPTERLVCRRQTWVGGAMMELAPVAQYLPPVRLTFPMLLPCERCNRSTGDRAASLAEASSGTTISIAAVVAGFEADIQGLSQIATELVFIRVFHKHHIPGWLCDNVTIRQVSLLGTFGASWCDRPIQAFSVCDRGLATVGAKSDTAMSVRN